jgi:4-amino-4-deoxy-L-arabinose transferase-like glycosyltransferase
MPSRNLRSIAASVRPFHRDLLCVLVLAVACMLLRVPSLDRATLNPDESQYEATASYLVATGTSSFSLPYGAPGTFTVFKLMTWLFGPYPMFEVRLLVQLICLAIALMLYDLVRRETNRWCGLVSGLVFLHFTMLYEGLTVNREWFAALLSLAGIGLYAVARSRQDRPRDWILLLSGLAAGMALFFKLQASFIVFAIPVVLIWEASAERRPASALRSLGFHAAGGLLAGVLYLLPFLLAGTMTEFLGYVFADWNVFVLGNEQAVQGASNGVSGMYFERFYWHQPHRPLLLAVYGFALVGLGSSIGGLLGRRRKSSSVSGSFVLRPGVLVFVAYLVAAMLCVKLGNRFFGHYYLLMMPPVAALSGLSLYYFTVEARRCFWGRVAGLCLAGLLILDRGIALGRLGLGRLLASWPESALYVVYLLAACGIVIFALARPWRRAGAVVAVLIALEAGLLVIGQQRAETPASMSHSRHRFDELARFVVARGKPGDRMFVWGWAPEIYSLTRLESASHLTSCQYVVNDFLGAPERPSLNAPWVEMMMRDLSSRKPRFIVDASARSWTSTEPWIYGLEHYPGFELVEHIRVHYVARGELDGCAVFERRER